MSTLQSQSVIETPHETVLSFDDSPKGSKKHYLLSVSFASYANVKRMSCFYLLYYKQYMQNPWNNLPRPFFILAPMEAVTDVVFRHVVKEAATPDLFFTEFTNATGWVHAGEKAIRGRLIKTEDEDPIIAQIWGGEVDDMARLAQYCKELGYQGIDINMGCPAKSAVKSGGSALIRKPELAAAAIASAKTAGLPVSVKTRLGYTHIDEWRDWLTHLFRQDIVNVTIHLRTKREMSKVPAHFEIIPEIVRLRDEIAPHTFLTINGDIRDRTHGEALAREYGIDGVMIGRGVFHNPFAFEQEPKEHTKDELLDLLSRQLDLYDEWHPQLQRPFETLKRFFKIYVRDFAGASELREKLMGSTTTDEVRALLLPYR
jgi:tRNA-dihydrouridine synthase